MFQQSFGFFANINKFVMICSGEKNWIKISWNTKSKLTIKTINKFNMLNKSKLAKGKIKIFY